MEASLGTQGSKVHVQEWNVGQSIICKALACRKLRHLKIINGCLSASRSRKHSCYTMNCQTSNNKSNCKCQVGLFSQLFHEAKIPHIISLPTASITGKIFFRSAWEEKCQMKDSHSFRKNKLSLAWTLETQNSYSAWQNWNSLYDFSTGSLLCFRSEKYKIHVFRCYHQQSSA